MPKPRKNLLVLQDVHRLKRRLDSMAADMADAVETIANLEHQITTPAHDESADLPERCLNLGEAAAYLKVTPEYLSRLIRRGEFPAAVLPSDGETARTYRIAPEDIRAWLRAQRVTVTELTERAS